MYDTKNVMLTANEAAIYLGLTIGYLYKLTARKKIPHYKPFGNRIYFDKNELDDFIRARRVEVKDDQK